MSSFQNHLKNIPKNIKGPARKYLMFLPKMYGVFGEKVGDFLYEETDNLNYIIGSQKSLFTTLSRISFMSVKFLLIFCIKSR